MSRFCPFAYENSIYEIDPLLLKKFGIKTILSDLDNTLDPIKSPHPSQKAKECIARLKENDIRLIITSNNTGERVSIYAKELGVDYASMMAKPFSYKIKAYLENNHLKKEETVLIGDQIMTDVLSGNGAGLRVILTKPLVKQEPIWTKLNRLFDRPIRAFLFKRKKLIPLKEKLS